MARLRGTSMLQWIVLLSTLVVALASSPAGAANILLVERSIRISASHYDPVLGLRVFRDSSSADTVGYGPWYASLTDGDLYPVSASQGSLVDSVELSGGASLAKGESGSWAQSLYRVVFSVDADTPYDFAVDNIDSDPAGLAFPSGEVALDRVDPDDFDLVLESIYSVYLYRVVPGGPGGPDFSDAGVLPPGTYKLDFEIHHPGSHFYGSPASAGFSLVMVPEPGTHVLIVVALVMLGMRRWLIRYPQA